MKGIAICAVLLALGASYFFMASSRVASPVEEQYQQYLAEYRKSISNGEEYEMRLRIFEENLRFIEETNAQGNSYTVGINQFADMTHEEYTKYLGYKSVANKSPAKAYTGVVAGSVDWRTKGAVNTVQNQGQCGSCWAFSAVAAYEGAYFLKTGKLTKFSEQQLVDCSTAQGNEGCNGGLMDQAFDYLKENQFCTEDDYPYTAVDGTCDTSKCTSTGDLLTSYTDVAKNNGDALRAALNLQPVSVAIEADKLIFQLYSGGVFDNIRCGFELDHGVTAVGYGTDSASGKDYWIVRNSWGGSWGEKGYIRLSANSAYDVKGGMCGILMDSSYPTF